MQTSEGETPDHSPADPRPDLVRAAGEVRVRGLRCGACGHPSSQRPPRCPSCGEQALVPDSFGPSGSVFSSTVLRVPVADRTPPMTFAYVDLDDGPRLLAHVSGGTAPTPGTRVRLIGWTTEGDPLVAEES